MPDLWSAPLDSVPTLTLVPQWLYDQVLAAGGSPVGLMPAPIGLRGKHDTSPTAITDRLHERWSGKSFVAAG